MHSARKQGTGSLSNVKIATPDAPLPSKCHATPFVLWSIIAASSSQISSFALKNINMQYKLSALQFCIARLNSLMNISSRLQLMNIKKAYEIHFN